MTASVNIPRLNDYERVFRPSVVECSIPLAVSCQTSMVEYSWYRAEQLSQIGREWQYLTLWLCHGTMLSQSRWSTKKETTKTDTPKGSILVVLGGACLTKVEAKSRILTHSANIPRLATYERVFRPSVVECSIPLAVSCQTRRSKMRVVSSERQAHSNPEWQYLQCIDRMVEH